MKMDLRRGGSRRTRILGLAAISLLAAAVAPVGAGAAPPSPGTASISITVDANCLATVTYTWQGFKGKNLVAEYVVVNSTGTSFSIGLAYAYDTGVSGTGSGTKTFQFTAGGTSPATRFGAIGRLGKFDRNGQFQETKPDAERTALGPFNPNGCGYPVI